MRDTAKTILCYGDSNTWGAVPRGNDRYPRSIRWPGALQRLLGDDYEVVAEGLCGRTLVAVDPKKPHRTGIAHLQAIIETADPVDTLIIMLGTNDIKTAFGLTAEQIAEHLEQTLELIKNGKFESEKIPRILIICPPPVIIPATNDLDPRMVNGPQLFKKLPGLYKKVTEKYGCDFMNAGDYLSSSSIDGYHLDKESHLKLAEVIKTWIQKF